MRPRALDGLPTKAELLKQGLDWAERSAELRPRARA